MQFTNFSRSVANETYGRLPGFEGPLVDLQRLDLRLECRRRHAEPPRGTERPGHAALAFTERSLDGVLFPGLPPAGAEAHDPRAPAGPTGEPTPTDRYHVRITD